MDMPTLAPPKPGRFGQCHSLARNPGGDGRCPGTRVNKAEGAGKPGLGRQLVGRRHIQDTEQLLQFRGGSRRHRHRHRELHRCFQGLGPPGAAPPSAPRSLAFCSASGREGEGPRGLLPHCSAEQSIQVGVALWMGHLTALTLSRLVSRSNPSASSGPTDKAAAVCPVCSLSGHTAVITQCHRELFRTQPTSSSHFQPLLRT